MNQGQIYEYEIVLVMDRYLKRESICIDVGAHVGDVLREMEKFAPDARHYAFEPLPHLIDNLIEKHPNSHVFGCALSDQKGTEVFYHVKNDHAYSGLRRRTYDIPNPDIEKIEVEVKRLDDVIPDDVPIALIKLDIEGGEYHAMLGGKETINRSRPLIIFEASDHSTGHYGVTSEMMYDLLCGEFAYEISTMRRWLTNKPALTRDAFLAVYGDEYYFIAYPPGTQ